jgi:hypothetical protein
MLTWIQSQPITPFALAVKLSVANELRNKLSSLLNSIELIYPDRYLIKAVIQID